MRMMMVEASTTTIDAIDEKKAEGYQFETVALQQYHHHQMKDVNE